MLVQKKPKIIGIYKISSNIKPERIYIGSSVNLLKRFDEHKRTLKLNKHDSPILQCHYNKYGQDDLAFIIIEQCTPEFLVNREQYYIDNDPHKGYFNVCKTAGNCLGKKHSEKTRRNMGIKRRERIISKGTRKKLSNSLKGRPSPTKGKKQSSEIIERRVAKLRGRKRSAEVRLKMSQNCHFRGENRSGEKNSFFGKKHTEETKQKMSEIHSNISEETRAKMSDAKKGNQWSAESKNKLSESKEGHETTKETREKISKANKGKRYSPSTQFKEGHKYFKPYSRNGRKSK